MPKTSNADAITLKQAQELFPDQPRWRLKWLVLVHPEIVLRHGKGPGPGQGRPAPTIVSRRKLAAVLPAHRRMKPRKPRPEAAPAKGAADAAD